jgi:hypothetical protein
MASLSVEIYFVQNVDNRFIFLENYIKMKILSVNIIYFTRETKCIHFSYYVHEVSIVRIGCAKDIGVVKTAFSSTLR